jgi:cytochrome c-type biogenesis protein CcmH/NrfG
MHMSQLSAASRSLFDAMLNRVDHHPVEASGFDHAIDAYTHEHYGEAFRALAQLADAGHARAARMALLMHDHGPRLFGHRFDADAARRARWLSASRL